MWQIIQGMTTAMTPTPIGVVETRTAAVARRLRGALAEREISHAEAGRRIGINPSGMSRRMKGVRPWNMDELQKIESETGVDLDYVLTGRRNAENPHPDGPDRGETTDLLEEVHTPQNGHALSTRELTRVIPIFRDQPEAPCAA